MALLKLALQRPHTTDLVTANGETRSIYRIRGPWGLVRTSFPSQ